MMWSEVRYSLLAAGVSYRQFDYWCRQGYLGQQDVFGSGHAREVTFETFARARVMGQLVAAGFTAGAATARIAAELVGRGEGKQTLTIGVTVPTQGA